MGADEVTAEPDFKDPANSAQALTACIAIYSSRLCFEVRDAKCAVGSI